MYTVQTGCTGNPVSRWTSVSLHDHIPSPSVPHAMRVPDTWLGGVVVRALDLRLEVACSIPAAALSSATLDKLFTHIVPRL